MDRSDITASERGSSALGLGRLCDRGALDRRCVGVGACAADAGIGGAASAPARSRCTVSPCTARTSRGALCSLPRACLAGNHPSIACTISICPCSSDLDDGRGRAVARKPLYRATRAKPAQPPGVDDCTHTAHRIVMHVPCACFLAGCGRVLSGQSSWTWTSGIIHVYIVACGAYAVRTGVHVVLCTRGEQKPRDLCIIQAILSLLVLDR